MSGRKARSPKQASPRKRKEGGSEENTPAEGSVALDKSERAELERLREAMLRLTEQPALLEQVRRDRDLVLQTHEELVKRLKAELAHWKASAEDSKHALTDAKEALAMYAQLTNVTMADEGDGYRCVATNRDGQRAMTFHLTALEDGTVDYRCEEVTDPLAPSFFREDINFDKGQASVFFREVLKVLTREPVANAK